MVLGQRANKAGKEARAYMLTNASFFLVFLCYPSCSRKVFQYFITTTFDGDYGTFLAADMSINVADGSYQSMTAYALLMLLVWPFGVPIGVATLLWRH